MLRVTLAELAAADIHLHPAEAVAIVAALCRRQARGELRGMPSCANIRLSRDGELTVEGPIPTGDAGSIARMAQLLSDILPGFGAAPQMRASGGVRLVIARALGTIDLPPYETVDEFAAALDRFAVPDLAASLRALVVVWDEKRQRPRVPRGPLTISDVRRARRATGLTLDDIANVAGVAASELRALEWGDLRAWPRTAAGRDRIARYARAAGLDEAVVLSIAWPLLDEVSPVVEAVAIEEALVPAGTQALAVVQPPLARPADFRVWLAWVIAAVAVVMLAISTIALARERATLRPPALPPALPQRAIHDAVLPLPVAPEVMPDTLSLQTSSAITPAVRGSAHADAPRPRETRANAKKPPAAKKSFLQKELFRIVFR